MNSMTVVASGGSQCHWRQVYAVEKGTICWQNMTSNEFLVKGRIGLDAGVFSNVFRFTYHGVMTRKDGFSFPIDGWFPVTLAECTLTKSKGLGKTKALRKIVIDFPKGDCWVRTITLLFEIEVDEHLNVKSDFGKSFAEVLKIAVASKVTMKTVAIPSSQTF
jgi:hypothetical protein